MLERMLHHKLLTEGEQGQGVVTKRHDQMQSSGTRSYSFRFELQGHIRFPDGSEGDFRSELLSSHNVGWIEVGQIVPVRYDPADHSKVVLDVVALEEQQKARGDKAQADLKASTDQAIADADAQTARANTPRGIPHAN